MSTPITLDIRCGHCNKKLSEVTPPVTLMIQRIKCPRCGEIVETYIVKETIQKPKREPQETPKYKPKETPKYASQETPKISPQEKPLYAI